MTPLRDARWYPWLRIAAPAAFLGYGVYLVTHSALVAAAVGLVVLVACRVLLGLGGARPDVDDR